MLNQVIYTRCLPCRVLTEGGAVRVADGFGVFAFSEETLRVLHKNDAKMLTEVLSVKNASSELSSVGMFNSYEYIQLNNEVYALMFEYLRPQNNEQRKNGKSHRIGNYIKQCLLGTPQGYPYEWFGADVWTAHLKPENDYYLDDDPSHETEPLPMAEDSPRGGWITDDILRDFVADGRADALKKAVWYIIRTFSLPEEVRRPLVIRDTPRNVELWIAAAQRAFSEKAAGKITFVTNRARLENYNTGHLFYYLRDDGSFSSTPYGTGAARRRMCCLLVGVHPQECFAMNLRAVESGCFELLDGREKTISVSGDGTLSAPFYRDAVLLSEDINDFCSVVLPELQYDAISGELTDIYDAYRYLLDSDNKNDKKRYTDVVRYLTVLQNSGLKNSRVFSSYLTDSCLSFYDELLTEDERSGFKLILLLYSIAPDDGKSKVADTLCGVFRSMLSGLENCGSRLPAVQKAAEGFPPELCSAATYALFDEDTVVAYARGTLHASPETARAVLWMLERSLYAQGIGYDALLQRRNEFSLFCICFFAMSEDRELTRAQLSRLQRHETFYYSLVISVSGYLADKRDSGFTRWWELVTEAADGNLRYVIRRLTASPYATEELTERVLTNRLRHLGCCDEDLLDVLREFLAGCKEENAGLSFFLAWKELSGASECGRIIAAAQDSHLKRRPQAVLFEAFDRDIPMEKVTHELTMLREWGLTLNAVSVSFAFTAFAQGLKRTRYYDDALHLLHGTLRMRLPSRPDIEVSGAFRTMCREAVECGSEEFHLGAMNLFLFGGVNELRRYLNAYITSVLEVDKGNAATVMLDLASAVNFDYYVPKRTPEEKNTVRTVATEVMSRVFGNYWNRKTQKQVVKAEYPDRIKAMLDRILQMGKAGYHN